MQFGGGHRTDAGRITQPYILADRSKVEAQLLVVIGGFAFKIERSSTCMARKLVDLNPIASKHEFAIQIAQSTRHTSIVGCAIFDLDRSLRERISNRTLHRHVDSRLTA